MNSKNQMIYIVTMFHNAKFVKLACTNPKAFGIFSKPRTGKVVPDGLDQMRSITEEKYMPLWCIQV